MVQCAAAAERQRARKLAVVNSRRTRDPQPRQPAPGEPLHTHPTTTTHAHAHTHTSCWGPSAGGPLLSRFVGSFRELASFHELLRTQVELILVRPARGGRSAVGRAGGHGRLAGCAATLPLSRLAGDQADGRAGRAGQSRALEEPATQLPPTAGCAILHCVGRSCVTPPSRVRPDGLPTNPCLGNLRRRFAQAFALGPAMGSQGRWCLVAARCTLDCIGLTQAKTQVPPGPCPCLWHCSASV